MRVTVLRTWSNSCNALYEPLYSLGIEVHTIIYDLMNVGSKIDFDVLWHQLTTERYRNRNQLNCGNDILKSKDEFVNLPTLVDKSSPDWVLLIGCCDVGGAIMPSVDILGQIGRRHKFVHLCCDGCEDDWASQLANYYDHGNFTLQINIDGNRRGPIGEREGNGGLTTLCPIDADKYPNPVIPWHVRPIRLGFRGGYSLKDQNQMGPGELFHPRSAAIKPMISAGLLNAKMREIASTQEQYIQYLVNCKCIWNHAATGSGVRMHVKARVLEAALASCLVFDTEGSPTSEWFDPGVDYFTYSNDPILGVNDMAHHLEWVDNNPVEAEGMALRLHQKVLNKHSSKVFWTKVLDILYGANWRVQ